MLNLFDEFKSLLRNLTRNLKLNLQISYREPKIALNIKRHKINKIKKFQILIIAQYLL